MRATPRLLVNMAVVLALGVVMTAWVIGNVVGSGFFNEPIVVTADFASSGGVFTNQEVTYRGVLVGKVGDLRLNDDGVDVELLIEDEWEGKIPASVTAQVQSKSAVGEQFVNLTPAGASGDSLESGDVIPRERTSLPVDFQELLTSLNRVLEDVPPGRLRDLTQNLARGLEGRGDDIATILESLGTLARGFASVAPEQRRLLTNATITGREFLRTKDDFAAAIGAADEVLAGIGDEPGELSALFRANDRLAREGSALLARHGRDLARGIGGLADLASYQADHLSDLEQTLEHVPGFLHAIEDASIPWRSPDGRFFYRIRTGYVWDNARRSWPCKYRLRQGYERFQFERAERDTNTSMSCLPTPKAEENELIASLVDALTLWAREHPGAAPGAAATVADGIAVFVAEPIAAVATPVTTPSPSPSVVPSPAPTATS